MSSDQQGGPARQGGRARQSGGFPREEPWVSSAPHLPPVEARNGQAGGLLVTQEDRLEGPGSGWGPGSRGFLKSPHPGNLAGCTRGLAPTGWLYSFQRAIQAPKGQQICSSHRKWSQAHSWGSHPPPQPGKSRHLISALGYSPAPFTPWSCPLVQPQSS